MSGVHLKKGKEENLSNKKHTVMIFYPLFNISHKEVNKESFESNKLDHTNRRKYIFKSNFFCNVHTASIFHFNW